jgi:hypothetical protein
MIANSISTCARKSFWASAILIAGALLAASPNSASAQGLYGYGAGYGVGPFGMHYPSWGYAVGMPGYYSDFRAQSYYAAPWIAGWEAPWYGTSWRGAGGYGCAYGGGYGFAGAGRYPWIWNRHAGFVTRGFVTASAPAKIVVYKNPFYKSGESSPSDTQANAPLTTTTQPQEKSKGLIRVVSNPHFGK